MTENPEQQLDKRLAALTQWRGGQTELWREAIAAAEHDDTPGKTRPWLRLNTPVWRIAAVITVLAGGTATVWFSSSEPTVLRQSPYNALLSPWVASPSRKPPPATDNNSSMYGSDGMANYFTPQILPGPTRPGGVYDPDRHVVRKATIELVSDDVALAFVKCRQLISEANGEFIEASSLTGSGKTARGNLTLRITASRLSDVLNDLRRIAKVRAEETHGEDVTTQVIDLEARLRNEQRVEAELLDLLEKRSDAPLQELLEMRRQINFVRESIEKLTAQSERLDRLMALASVLVVIRPADAPAEEPETGLGAYFSDKFHASWTGGLRLLADTLSGGLRVAVGGLMWWVLLAATFVTARHHIRNARAQHDATG